MISGRIDRDTANVYPRKDGRSENMKQEEKRDIDSSCKLTCPAGNLPELRSTLTS
jgi:hypothetical protein